MPRQVHKLAQRDLMRLPEGRHADGAGLYLVVSGGSRAWSFRYMRQGKGHELGLGPIRDVSLAQARRKASAMRQQIVYEGVEPAVRRVVAKPLAEPTFCDAMEAFLRDRSHQWRSLKHAQDWRGSVERYVLPTIGDKAPGDVSKSDVLAILRPLWQDKGVTASRLRGRIEQILEHYHAHHGDTAAYANPASWKGLQHILGSTGNGATNFVALPWQRVPDLMAWLARQSGVAALALRFLVLTASRTNEVRGATWAEVDLEQRIWRIPAARMKANTEHSVPLSDPALAILEGVQQLDTLLFPQLAKNGMLTVLQEFAPGCTVHGMRATFSTWAAEHGYAHEVVEMSLAHLVGNKVSQAYQRSRLLEARRKLMEEWAAFCGRA